MAQARPAAQGIPQAAIYFAAALIASVVISVMLVTGNVQLFGPSNGGAETSPQVLRSEAMWTTERLAQSGYLDPAARSAREWERQRGQQGSGY
jgi:hypothetical protein